MLHPASNKINRIFSSLRNTRYNGDLRSHHFSVAIRGGKVISPVLCNYNREFVFGKRRGTMHAEMNSLSYITNHRRTNHRHEYCYTLPFKGATYSSKVFYYEEDYEAAVKNRYLGI